VNQPEFVLSPKDATSGVTEGLWLVNGCDAIPAQRPSEGVRYNGLNLFVLDQSTVADQYAEPPRVFGSGFPRRFGPWAAPFPEESRPVRRYVGRDTSVGLNAGGTKYQPRLASMVHKANRTIMW